ncbi:hypothetical protein PHET_09536 [Paragonimus heterotremus]|uniref:Complex 1 LYR protein domain-containing protein n=1 Tax=Paragonimus heterotremus TaxID=100268 RepID=A0A8J4SH02_9TREM|nr:hypothetical protein PHET_09536 [Paragonimus heterotremus]
MNTTRARVLALYRRVFQLARHWRASSGLEADTLKEASYIRDEARSLFRQNATLTDEQEILVRAVLLEYLW